MNLETLRSALLWCFVINTAMLMVWFLMLALGRDWVYRMHGKWFKVSPEKFDAIHYSGIIFFKVFIFGFYLVPYLALLIVR